MLTARSAEQPYVEAASARRGEAYVCRGCGAPVTFKSGTIRTPHFAHRPDAACAFGARMSLAHLSAQGQIARALRTRGLIVELEAPLTGEADDRRIDVLVWPPDRPAARVAIEVQASDLSAEAIAARTHSYQRLGVPPLWLRLLDFGTFPAVQTLPARGTIWIERYRARAWERWVHDHLGGRLWFMDAGAGRVWRGQFVPAHRFRERAAVSPGPGEVSTRGADWTEARRWVDLELDGPFQVEDLKLGRGEVKGADGQLRPVAWFVPPGEDQVRPPFPADLSAAFQAERRGSSRDLRARAGGGWVTAITDGARSDWRTARTTKRPILGPPTLR